MSPRAPLILVLVTSLAAGCAPSRGATADASPTGDGSTPDSDTSCPAYCSADLQQVLDCRDDVIATCADNETCDGGVCVDPCTSAAADQSSIGCDFFTLVPPPGGRRGSCFAVLLTNAGRVPATLDVTYQGQSLAIDGMVRRPVGNGAGLSYEPLANGQLDVGEVAIVFLAKGATGIAPIACPAGVTAGVALDTSIDGTGVGDAFRIDERAGGRV